MSKQLLKIFGLEETYENAQAILLAAADYDEFQSPEEIPQWVRELPDFPDPFNEEEDA